MITEGKRLLVSVSVILRLESQNIATRLIPARPADYLAPDLVIANRCETLADICRKRGDPARDLPGPCGHFGSNGRSGKLAKIPLDKPFDFPLGLGVGPGLVAA